MLPYVLRFSVSLRRGAYEIFIYRSGLPNGHLAMLVFGAGTVRWVAFVEVVEATPTGCFVPAGHDSHRLSNDLFTCLCVFSVRPLSMDERHEAQNDNSHRSGRRSR